MKEFSSYFLHVKVENKLFLKTSQFRILLILQTSLSPSPDGSTNNSDG